MRILHVITSLKTGGAETLVVNLMSQFCSLGHEVGVAVFNAEHTDLMKRLEKECPECKIYRLGKSFYNPRFIFQLIPIICKYDIIHTHNSSAQLYAVLANIFCHKIMVTTEHNTQNRKRGNRILSLIDKWMYGRYDHVICISQQAEDNLRSYLQNERNSLKKIVTIYNGVNIDTIHSAQPLLSEKPDKFLVVMVAAFRPQKDHATLIKAMTKLSKEKFEAWLVGDGESHAEVERLISDLGMEDRVKMVGLRTDVPQILKTADVIVMSTHYEGLSLSNIEGMAAGKPFVASDVEGIREITKGFGILVPHEDADALAEAIKQLHDDKMYYKQIADKCYERATQFDISKMVSRYNDVYMSFSRL